MLKKYLFTATLLLPSLGIYAQQAKSTKFVFPPKGHVVVSEIQQDFYPELMSVEKPMPGGIPERKERYQPKKQMRSPLTPQNESLTDLGLGLNFNGNSFASATPCDNDLAISNDSKIISVVNSTLAYYRGDSTVSVTLGSSSFAAFTASLGLPHNEFDPKVVYDPNEDRFIVLCLNGFTDTTSSIILGFSQTNDPLGAWNLYTLPGNPLSNGLWTDYPMMALTENELFITVNLLYPDSSWQTGFNETIIWQLNKFNGYNNLPLNANLINNIQYAGKNIRNLCPVKGGSQLYGPDMYFLSNRNFEVQGDTFFLVHVLDTAGATGFGVTVTQLNSDADYFWAGDARQAAGHMLATNDSRVLGAFIENDKIQFVHNCMDTSTTFCAVYHGVISNVSTSPVVNGQLISDTLRDLGYPNISYAGSGASDHTAIITFDHTAPTVNPGVSAIKTDGNFNYSYIKKIVNGTSYVNVLMGTERWGDYMGSQRKYNATGEVWCAGYMGYIQGFNRWHRAYIAKLTVEAPPVSVAEPVYEDLHSTIYPNPSSDFITVDFELAQSTYLSFAIVDLQGKPVHLLMREYVKAGKNQFSFSVRDLAAGEYLFVIQNKQNIIHSRPIIKQ